jgi:hypothetical protein
MSKLALIASLVFSASTASASPTHHWWWVGERNVSHHDRRMIDVGDRAFRTLRLEAVAGDPEITGLGVWYADGTKQMVHLSPGSLERGPRDIVVNRGLRRINAIMVYEDPASPGRFAIYGR